MIEKETKKIKALIIGCLVLVAVGGANIACGIYGNRLVSVVSGLFCSIASSWAVMRNIRTLERYAVMKVEEEQILHGLDKSNA